MSEILNDFYARGPEHGNYDPSVIEINTPVDSIVSRIEMIIFTNKGEVLGDSEFGADLEFYLFKTQVDATYIEDIIKQQINKYIPEMANIPFDIVAEFISGGSENSDALLISVYVYEQEITAFFYDRKRAF